MTQSEYDFNRLLHQSQQLNAKISGSRTIPTIYRGLEQLEAFSSKLAAKTGIISSDTKQNFIQLNLCFTLYSSASIRHSELAKVNFVHVGLEAQVNAVGTDVAGYLQAEYEKKIVSSIERMQKEVMPFLFQ